MSVVISCTFKAVSLGRPPGYFLALTHRIGPLLFGLNIMGYSFSAPGPPETNRLIVSLRTPKCHFLKSGFARRYFRCGFNCFMFNAVQFLSLCVLSFNVVKITELPSVWERAANSAYHLLFRCLFRYVCSSFPLLFRTSFGL